jgi:hypothetical protein
MSTDMSQGESSSYSRYPLVALVPGSRIDACLENSSRRDTGQMNRPRIHASPDIRARA